MTEESLLIKGIRTVTQNQYRQIIDADIYIEGERILSVEKNINWAADIVIDGKNLIAIPGLINTHTHAPMSVLRGYADDMYLQDWLNKKIWPAESKITPDIVKTGTELSVIEMLKTGTTLYHDMYFFSQESIDICDRIGISAILGGIFIDFATNQSKNLTEYKNYTEELIKKTESSPYVKANIAPHAPYTCSEETLSVAVELAEKYKTSIQIHVAETEKEVRDFLREKKITPYQYLEQAGIVNYPTIAIHSVWAKKSDIALMKTYNISVSHNPVSNMKLSVGKAAPVKLFFESQIAVGLGTDSAVSNNNLDMFETMKIAALLHKFSTKNPTICPAQKIFDMATIEGARALGLMEERGSIEAGKIADIVLLNRENIRLLPDYNLISNIVYAIPSSAIDTVITRGKIVVKNGNVINADIDSVRKGIESAMEILTG